MEIDETGRPKIDLTLNFRGRAPVKICANLWEVLIQIQNASLEPTFLHYHIGDEPAAIAGGH